MFRLQGPSRSFLVLVTGFLFSVVEQFPRQHKTKSQFWSWWVVLWGCLHMLRSILRCCIKKSVPRFVALVWTHANLVKQFLLYHMIRGENLALGGHRNSMASRQRQPLEHHQTRWALQFTGVSLFWGIWTATILISILINPLTDWDTLLHKV